MSSHAAVQAGRQRAQAKPACNAASCCVLVKVYRRCVACMRQHAVNLRAMLTCFRCGLTASSPKGRKAGLVTRSLLDEARASLVPGGQGTQAKAGGRQRPKA